ncbi:MAG: ATP-dependent DNA helicase RecG [Deltaproteobacteria bacterium]|nr:ATP-dependent DNA helicase RecG [Deltaproteobacteria bacterium]
MERRSDKHAAGPDAENARVLEIVASMRKPLLFASKDGFQHIGSVKSLEPLMARLCGEAHSIEADNAGAFTELERLFAGFDGLAVEEKKERVGKALAMLDALESPSVCPALSPVAPPQLPPAPEEIKRRLKLLKTPLASIKGVGPKLAERFSKKGLATVEDMLYFLPLRYEDRSSIKRIRELTPGFSALVTGEVMAMGEARYGRRKVYEMAVSDGSAILKVKWFHYKLSYMKGRYKPGQKLLIFGTVSAFGAQKEMIHPDIEPYSDGGVDEVDSGGVAPVYSQVEPFHQKTIRKIVRGVVEAYSGSVPNGVPPEVARRCGVAELGAAFREAHMPADIGRGSHTAARKSLVFDELFLLELGLALKRQSAKKEGGIAFASKGELEERLRGLLPFTLTRAQEKVLSEIKKDMSIAHPMNRLIQGDVGSGKTVVSFIAALKAMEAGYQAAIMAPTEILSEQHYLNIHRYAEALGIRAVLLTGSMKKAAKTKALASIRDGEAGLTVGTHALIQKDVDFKKLGLAVIDEQHRFGVVQRAALKKKGFDAGAGVSPDILIMTATPIPRTLSMTVFGDLDVSVIDELPPGRQPVATRVIREKDRGKAYDAIRREVAAGSQCYVVYPLVEESEELSLRDATNMKEHLDKDIFPEFTVGLLHGRMAPAEKETVMRDFKERRVDILVSTTVIEVGVDVPNATVMLIEHAERFGLAQLHQLRGRVGRGEKKSICLLLAQWTNTEDTYRRLKVMEETMDGFKIAEEDLKLRGPGDFIGTRQAGLPDFRTSEALADLTLLKKAREEAFAFLAANPGLKDGWAACVKEVLKARWEGRLELAEVG